MSSSALVMAQRFINTPMVANGAGVLVNDSGFCGLGTAPVAVTLGSYTLGRTYYRNRFIVGIYSATGVDLAIRISNPVLELVQASFARVMVQNGAGVLTEYLTSAATFTGGSAGPSNTAGWSWGSGSARVWEAADAGETKTFWLA